MCFDPITITMAVAGAALSAVTAGISGYAQTKSQNDAAIQQYQYQQQQQALMNKASVEQYNETISRQRVEQQRAAGSSLENTQQAILENQRRQASATANAATAGITGMPLGMLFNDYQVAIGNVASNLQTNYSQLNENLFFNLDSARREGQSRINQSIPAQPYLAQFSPMGAILAGVGTGINTLAGGFNPGAGGKTPKASTPAATPKQQSFYGPTAGGMPNYLWGQ